MLQCCKETMNEEQFVKGLNYHRIVTASSVSRQIVSILNDSCAMSTEPDPVFHTLPRNLRHNAKQ